MKHKMCLIFRFELSVGSGECHWYQKEAEKRINFMNEQHQWSEGLACGWESMKTSKKENDQVTQ